MTKVTAQDSFSHGPYTLSKGESAHMPDAIANDLVTAGLVSKASDSPAAAAPAVKAAPVQRNKAAPPVQTKVQPKADDKAAADSQATQAVDAETRASAE